MHYHSFPERRFGLDWLRIAAFAMLILYHIGMYFVPDWDWHIKASHPVEGLQFPMLAVNAWRLPLLFAISGVASRYLLAKGTASAFARGRLVRLLPALLFGSFVIVAPQAFVDVTVNHGYRGGFTAFYRSDYFDFSDRLGIILPTWNHLWFVAYLLVYSLILAAALALPPRLRRALQSGFDRLLVGPALLLVPAAIFFAARMLLARTHPETHNLVNDPMAHIIYFSAFAFGVGVARSAPAWRTIAAAWPAFVATAALGFAVVAAIELRFPGDIDPSEPWKAAYRLARALECWGAILGLMGLADRFLHRDGPARRYLTEAVFPYYIAHQTIIVIVAFWIRPLGLPNFSAFGILLLATGVGCALFYEMARRSGPLRPLFGLPPTAWSAAAATTGSRRAWSPSR